jgi:hypothetical protein
VFSSSTNATTTIIVIIIIIITIINIIFIIVATKQLLFATLDGQCVVQFECPERRDDKHVTIAIARSVLFATRLSSPVRRGNQATLGIESIVL